MSARLADSEYSNAISGKYTQIKMHLIKTNMKTKYIWLKERQVLN